MAGTAVTGIIPSSLLPGNGSADQYRDLVSVTVVVVGYVRSDLSGEERGGEALRLPVPVGQCQGGYGMCRKKTNPKIDRDDMIYLSASRESSFLGTLWVMDQLSGYVRTMLNRVDSLAADPGEMRENDLATRFRLAEMVCQSDRMLDELDRFRLSLIQFVGAEGDVKRNVERREMFMPTRRETISPGESTCIKEGRKMITGRGKEESRDA
jgi:hypothetical protein